VADGRTWSLLDVGDGRRLDRFGRIIVDRPAPGAREPRLDPGVWGAAAARFADGRWSIATDLPDPWTIAIDGLLVELATTDAGQVGLFPEHAQLWPWLAAEVRPGDEVLHLFAYTGATTLALARSGARVAHVDASRPAVAWARRNAERSELADRPIRWLVDDASAFVAREARRGRRYRGIVLDPPSYGHGPGGRPWRFATDIGALLQACAAVAATGAFVLVTAHTPGEDPVSLADRLTAAFSSAAGRTRSGPLALRAESGAVLRLGAWAGIMAGR
jgi:23S rRNA (cytosine1962-C5)-methyltransferase